MTPTLALTLLLAVLIGVSLGLLGGGGSILTVPILAYVAGLPAKEAIAASLVVVGVTSAVGAVSHARAGRVRWRTGVRFGAAGISNALLQREGHQLVPANGGEREFSRLAQDKVRVALAGATGFQVDPFPPRRAYRF